MYYGLNLHRGGAIFADDFESDERVFELAGASDGLFAFNLVVEANPQDLGKTPLRSKIRLLWQ